MIISPSKLYTDPFRIEICNLSEDWCDRSTWYSNMFKQKAFPHTMVHHLRPLDQIRYRCRFLNVGSQEITITRSMPCRFLFFFPACLVCWTLSLMLWFTDREPDYWSVAIGIPSHSRWFSLLANISSSWCWNKQSGTCRLPADCLQSKMLRDAKSKILQVLGSLHLIPLPVKAQRNLLPSMASA